MLTYHDGSNTIDLSHHAQRQSGWIGTEAPVSSMMGLDLHARPAFHVDPTEAGRFDNVWIFERPLAERNWKLLLDSSIRLLKPDGTLVIKAMQNQFLSIISLKSFLFRAYSFDCVLIDEYINGPEFVAIFKIDRSNSLERIKDDIWTFGVITQGRRPDDLYKLVSTIREYGGDRHQIIVAGPIEKRIDRYGVVQLNGLYSDRYADICIKKNDIVSKSENENICIVHDRYWLNPDFFSGFDRYGYDFEFVTINQFHESGKEYPAYCAVDSRYNLLWGKVYNCRDESDVWTGQYLNGGLIISKRHILSRFPFNSLIHHNQGEDVELAHVLMQASIVPRINRYSSATTSAPDHLTDAFEDALASDYETIVFAAETLRDAPHSRGDPLVSSFASLNGVATSFGKRHAFRQDKAATGILLFGPYLALDAGRYRISATISREDSSAVGSIRLDVVTKLGDGKIYEEDVPFPPSIVTRDFVVMIDLPEPVTDLEIRAFTSSDAGWTITIPEIGAA